MSGKPKNTRGPKPGTGGRKPGPKKVKLTVSVLPETVKAIKALGSPGAVLDKIPPLIKGIQAMTKWGTGAGGGGGTVDDYSSGRREAEDRMRAELRRLLDAFKKA